MREEERRPGFELGNGPFTVRAVRLKGLAGTLGWPTQPDCIFAHELAGRVRVIAGLDQRPILLHSEKWPDYHGSLQELRRVRARLHCNPEDAVVVVWGPEEDTVTAADEIRLRYVDAIDGIPNETRQPFADGSTDFERILPGPDRMYPDTDSPADAGHPRAGRAACAPGCAAALGARGALRRRRRAGPDDLLPDPAGRREAGGPGRGARRADLRQACVLFRRAPEGAAPRRAWGWTAFPTERVVRVLRARSPRPPVLWQAWDRIVRLMAAAPGRAVDDILCDAPLGTAPDGWRGTGEGQGLGGGRAAVPAGAPGRTARRGGRARAAVPLRDGPGDGRSCAAGCRPSRWRARSGRRWRTPMSTATDPLKGYKGRSRASAANRGACACGATSG